MIDERETINNVVCDVMFDNISPREGVKHDTHPMSGYYDNDVTTALFLLSTHFSLSLVRFLLWPKNAHDWFVYVRLLPAARQRWLFFTGKLLTGWCYADGFSALALPSVSIGFSVFAGDPPGG